MTPQVSVIIPCHNGAAYVERAVDSVLRQSVPAAECIVVDDGSTDATAEILRTFGDRIVVLRGKRVGRAGAIDRGLRRARGSIIAFLDADDRWHEHKLERQLPALETGTAGLVHCRVNRSTAERTAVSPADAAGAVGWALPHLIQGNCVCCSSVVVRRSVLDEVGAFDGRYWPCDDFDLWLRIATRFRFVFIDEPLVDYRVHSWQASADRKAVVLQEMRVLGDFLSKHPDVRRAFSRRWVRSVTCDRLYERAAHYYAIGRLGIARQLFRAYVRRWPFHPRGCAGVLRAHAPWMLYERYLRRDRPGAVCS